MVSISPFTGNEQVSESKSLFTERIESLSGHLWKNPNGVLLIDKKDYIKLDIDNLGDDIQFNLNDTSRWAVYQWKVLISTTDDKGKTSVFVREPWADTFQELSLEDINNSRDINFSLFQESGILACSILNDSPSSVDWSDTYILYLDGEYYTSPIALWRDGMSIFKRGEKELQVRWYWENKIYNYSVEKGDASSRGKVKLLLQDTLTDDTVVKQLDSGDMLKYYSKKIREGGIRDGGNNITNTLVTQGEHQRTTLMTSINNPYQVSTNGTAVRVRDPNDMSHKDTPTLIIDDKKITLPSVVENDLRIKRIDNVDISPDGTKIALFVKMVKNDYPSSNINKILVFDNNWNLLRREDLSSSSIDHMIINDKWDTAHIQKNPIQDGKSIYSLYINGFSRQIPLNEESGSIKHLAFVDNHQATVVLDYVTNDNDLKRMELALDTNTPEIRKEREKIASVQEFHKDVMAWMETNKISSLSALQKMFEDANQVSALNVQIAILQQESLEKDASLTDLQEANTGLQDTNTKLNNEITELNKKLETIISWINSRWMLLWYSLTPEAKTALGIT